MDQVQSGTLKEDFRAGVHGEASWYGSSSSRRRQSEYRYVRVLELQTHRSPRHRPVRRGTRTGLCGGERQDGASTRQGLVVDCGTGGSTELLCSGGP